MKPTLLLSYLLRVTLVVSACLLVMFDSWPIALAIMPVVVLDYLVHKTSTRKMMMGLIAVLLFVQAVVIGILSIKFVLYEEEMSFFQHSLQSPSSGFVDQVRASYVDMRSGNVASGVNTLRHSASKALMGHAKSMQHSLGVVDQKISQYLHVTDLISFFGETTGKTDSGEEGAYDYYGEEENIYEDSDAVIKFAFGELPSTTFPDLKHRSSEEVRKLLPNVFGALPQEGFSKKYWNPCWETYAREGGKSLHCLPAVYLLGQPKSGTTDLYARLARHHDIHTPQKKEIRWFTRGEFSDQPYREAEIMGVNTSIYEYAESFSKAVPHIKHEPDRAFTIDGGPHTFWWPLQAPDGSPPLPELVPPVQVIRELTPHAKFLITLSNPVNRMYSDYHFLNDDRRLAHPPQSAKKGGAGAHGGESDEKSPEIFHERVVQQVSAFRRCVSEHMNSSAYLENLSALPQDTTAAVLSFLSEDLGDETKQSRSVSPELRQIVVGRWFRAAQICAHDRHAFGRAGWGRLSIGLYSLYYEKWLEHFYPSQFKVVRLEDYDSSPKEYLKDIFAFLEVDMPVDDGEWEAIIGPPVKNQHKTARPPMLPETKVLLEKFYRPYNILLAKSLRERRFTWSEFFTTHTPHHDIHGPSAMEHDSHERADDFFTSKVSQKSNQLRYGGFDPRGFSLAGLQPPPVVPAEKFVDGNESTEFNGFMRRIIKRASPPSATEFDDKTGDNALCAAAFGLDLAALKYLLWEVGIPAKNSRKRTPYHCLAYVYTMSEASSKALLFSMLKGVDSWMTPMVESSMPKYSDSIRSMDIVETLGPMTVKVAEWLFAAGFRVDVATPSDGITALQLAAIGGMTPLIKFLLEHGADPNTVTKEKTTPLMYALAHGHCEAAAVLVKHGADMDHRDIRGVSPRDLIEVSGPVSANDALKYFNVTQSPVRTIDRPLHPTYPSSAPAAAQNNGGWDTTRLKGYEEDMHCDVDQYELDEISGVEIFEKYLARQRPILLRAGSTFAAKWPALERYSRAGLLKEHGDEIVTVSSIPYASKFGGTSAEALTIAEYINEMTLHNITGGDHPWYVFKGNPIAKVNEEKDRSSVVDFDVIPTPLSVSQVFTYIGQGKNYDRKAAHAKSAHEEATRNRKEFINAQWALGGAGSGAPVHFHNAAWNALVYGAKKWFLYPPHDMIMSNTQIREFVENDLEKFATRRNFSPVKPVTCVQTSGDIMIVPENWGHGVLNIQDSIAVATESKHGMWRLKQSLPFHNILTELSPNRKPPRPNKTHAPF